jgi:hypothetical protein
MAYKVVVHPRVQATIASWGLSNFVLVDVYLMLHEVLSSQPAAFLRRAEFPFDGMLFEFNLVDPENRLRQHEFVFLVTYGQDEQTLQIAKGGYVRRDGV